MRKSKKRPCSPKTGSGAWNWHWAFKTCPTPENLSLMQHAGAALKAHAVWKRDVDYLVKKNEEGKEEVVIIDENTGRLMFGRRWSDGLHQAVEAKEGVKIENENQTLATITFQNLFRLYPKLGGMTGTAKTEEDEFRKIYALDVVQVPTNKPMIRQDHPDIIYKSQEAKLRGIAREVLTLFARQQPVLIGTRSVEMSERVSDRLRFDRLQLLALTDLLRDKLENTKGSGQGQIRRVERHSQPASQSATVSPKGQDVPVLTPGRLTEAARHFQSVRPAWPTPPTATLWRNFWKLPRRIANAWTKP